MSEYTKIGRIRPVFRGEWSSAGSYTVLDIVRSPDGAAAYAALKDVPAGTALTNADYWQAVVDIDTSALKPAAAKWTLLESIVYDESTAVNGLERNGLNLKGLYIGVAFPIAAEAQSRNLHVYLSDGTNLYSYVQNTTSTTKERNVRIFCELADGGKRELLSEVTDMTSGRYDATNVDKQLTLVGSNDGVSITRYRFESSSYAFPAGTEIQVWGYE